jgi:D-glycero-D-manno-heptose 1,7-bisphosphate phosphatase
MVNLTKIDKSFTLFIDRDGVLNHEKKENYILNWKEFCFYDGVLPAMKILAKYFGKIILITNQKGVGKGLMTIEDLTEIHINMQNIIEEHGGVLTAIYACTDLDNDSPNRKPNAGMAFMAKNDFESIDFSKSIMIGNKLSDMQFARNANITSVFVATTNPEVLEENPVVDYRFNNLLEVANFIEQACN